MRHEVGYTDTLVVNGFEIEGSVLMAMVKPENRVLWQFVLSANKKEVQAVLYNEEHVIWMDKVNAEAT